MNIIKEQEMQEILEGNVECKKGHHYIVAGTFKSNKTGKLIYLAASNLKNDNFKVDEGKIPTILFISKENRIFEIYERLRMFITHEENMHYEEIKDIYTETIPILKTFPNNIKVLYVELQAIVNQYYIKDKIEELYYCDDKQVVMIIYDHISKELNSLNKYHDYDINLEGIISIFNQIARSLNIPIVTSIQLSKTYYDKMVDKCDLNINEDNCNIYIIPHRDDFIKSKFSKQNKE